jgi:transposase
MDAKENNFSKHFSSDEKKVAITLWKAKVPLKAIREQCNMSERTLRRILTHAKENPITPVLARKKGTGRTPKVTSHTLKQMKDALRKNPCLTAKQLKERIPGLALVNVRWIQQLCKDKLKLPSRKMAKKPLLSQRMKEQRLAFAMEYWEWNVEKWRDVMFSDESHFELHLGDEHGCCRRPVGSDRFDPKFTKNTVKHPAKVMVWGCFS